MYPSDSGFAAMVVGHGAGAGQMSSFVVRVASGLAERGIATATFDFPYITAGRKIPDRTNTLEAAWREAIAAARSVFGPLPLFIGGKSMGGRIASHVAAAGDSGPFAGLVFFGYPLHPPGKPDQRRDAHLPAIREPMLFVQGGADTFGTGEEIRALLPRLQRATLHEVAGGDHSYKVRGGRAVQDSVFPALMDAVEQWMRRAA